MIIWVWKTSPCFCSIIFHLPYKLHLGNLFNLCCLPCGSCQWTTFWWTHLSARDCPYPASPSLFPVGWSVRQCLGQLHTRRSTCGKANICLLSLTWWPCYRMSGWKGNTQVCFQWELDCVWHIHSHPTKQSEYQLPSCSGTVATFYFHKNKEGKQCVY